ncbi:MAG: hypothetical protein ACI88G_001983 [Woeseiaceae bacterium]|jgi:hypothetical protein
MTQSRHDDFPLPIRGSMALPASDVLIVVAEISVALVGFSGIIAVFRQRDISSWPPHIAYRFSFMCGQALFVMAFALLPFIPYYTARFSESTWQISSALFAISTACFMWLTYYKAKKLPVTASAHLSSGWMLTYQSGMFLFILLLAANALSFMGSAGPAAYLATLGWQLFIATSLFFRLLIGPGDTTTDRQ